MVSRFEADKEALPVNDAADTDLRRLPGDRVVHFPDVEELEHPQPVPDVPEHEAQVVVVLERLKLHPGDVLEPFGLHLPGQQAPHFLLGEPGELHVVAGALKVPEHPGESVLVEFGQLRQAVVGDHVCQFGGVGGVLLRVHGHLGTPEEHRSFKAAMAPDDQAGPPRDRDGRPPPVSLNHGSQGGDLRGRVRVRVPRVRLQLPGVDQVGV